MEGLGRDQKLRLVKFLTRHVSPAALVDTLGVRHLVEGICSVMQDPEKTERYGPEMQYVLGSVATNCFLNSEVVTGLVDLLGAAHKAVSTGGGNKASVYCCYAGTAKGCVSCTVFFRVWRSTC